MGAPGEALGVPRAVLGAPRGDLGAPRGLLGRAWGLLGSPGGPHRKNVKNHLFYLVLAYFCDPHRSKRYNSLGFLMTSCRRIPLESPNRNKPMNSLCFLMILSLLVGPKIGPGGPHHKNVIIPCVVW